MANKPIEDFKKFMLMHGNTSIGSFEINDNLDKAIEEINNIKLPISGEINIGYIKKYQLKSHAKAFLNSLYNIHPVGYIPRRKISKMWDFKIDDPNDIVNIYKKYTKQISPYRLPIDFCIDSFEGGSVNTDMVLTKDDDEYILKHIDRYYTHINLPNVLSQICVDSYIHEITHTQVDSYKRLVSEFYNEEIISIFNELLYTYYTNRNYFYYLLLVFLNNISDQYLDIKEYSTKPFDDKLNEFEYHNEIKYLSSTLKAINIFAKLINDDKFAKIIIKEINNLFDGNRTLEELLYVLNVTNTSCLDSDNVRKIIKRGK